MKSLFKNIFCCFFVTIAPLQAYALSCMPYDVTMAYDAADRSEDGYLAVLGALSFDQAALPVVDWEHQEDVQPDNFLTGYVSGKILDQTGFSSPFENPVTINVKCGGPWCAGLSAGRSLMFLKWQDDAFLLEVTPCGGFSFHDPSRETLEVVKTCMKNGGCPRRLRRPLQP